MFDHDLVVLDLDKGEYYSLDEIGRVFWHGLEQGKSLEEVADEIVGRYDVTREKALDDLAALCKTLVERGLVVDERR